MASNGTAAQAGKRSAAAKRGQATRKSQAARRRTTTSGTANSRISAETKQSEAFATQVAGVAESALLIPVGVALETRDRVVEVLRPWTSRTGAERELTRARRTARRFERRASVARNQLVRQTRQRRNRVVRELRNRRNQLTRLVRPDRASQAASRGREGRAAAGHARSEHAPRAGRADAGSSAAARLATSLQSFCRTHRQVGSPTGRPAESNNLSSLKPPGPLWGPSAILAPALASSDGRGRGFEKIGGASPCLPTNR